MFYCYVFRLPKMLAGLNYLELTYLNCLLIAFYEVITIKMINTLLKWKFIWTVFSMMKLRKHNGQVLCKYKLKIVTKIITNSRSWSYSFNKLWIFPQTYMAHFWPHNFLTVTYYGFCYYHQMLHFILQDKRVSKTGFFFYLFCFFISFFLLFSLLNQNFLSFMFWHSLLFN